LLFEDDDDDDDDDVMQCHNAKCHHILSTMVERQTWTETSQVQLRKLGKLFTPVNALWLPPERNAPSPPLASILNRQFAPPPSRD